VQMLRRNRTCEFDEEMDVVTRRAPTALIPRFIRLRDAPRYLGMDKNRFNREVRPHVPGIRIGIQGIAFDRVSHGTKHQQTNVRTPPPWRIWHIDKVIHGTRVCESTGTSDLEEAEALLMRRLQAARATRLFGAREEHTFREAATKYLEENQHKWSKDLDLK
jgi:hypothetical protein